MIGVGGGQGAPPSRAKRDNTVPDMPASGRPGVTLRYHAAIGLAATCEGSIRRSRTMPETLLWYAASSWRRWSGITVVGGRCQEQQQH
jgi:hypothetical protein